MAKLSARGRTIVFSVVKEQVLENNELCSWERKQLRLMSDNNILEKDTVIFKSDGRKHDYGWKVRGKLSVDKGATKDTLLAYYQRRGFTEEK